MIPVWLALVAGVASLPAPLQEAPVEPTGLRIVAAHLSATVMEEGWAAVHLTYELEGTAAGGPVGVQVLDFGPARVGRLEVDGVAVALDSAPDRPARRSAEIPTTTPRSRLALDYRVEGAWTASGVAGRLRIPVIGLDLPLEDAGPALFHAGVRIPEAWSVSGTFPTGLARDVEGSWTVDLAVVPSLVGLRARTDGSWRPGLPLVLDVVALAVLLGFGTAGLRHLRGVVARAEAGG